MPGPTDGGPRTLVLSQRGLRRAISRCCPYEFEDVLCEVEDAELRAPRGGRLASLAEGAANRTAGWAPGVALCSRGLPRARIARDHELLVVVAQFPSDLLWLRTLEGWRARCGRAVCWLEEIWEPWVVSQAGYLDVLREFDLVVLNCASTVSALERALGSRVVYLPPGVDALRFSPEPHRPPRVIDVMNIGRRSPVTHQALLERAASGDFFYVYDTVRMFEAIDPRQHRIAIAEQAKRSRYFVANRAKANRGDETAGQAEVGFRFFEGAAAGTVMIGDPPDSDAFHKNFDWPDAVIRIPYDAPEIGEILADLDAQPGRLASVRHENVLQSLARHDWARRWRAVLELLGVEPRPGLVARERALDGLAARLREAGP